MNSVKMESLCRACLAEEGSLQSIFAVDKDSNATISFADMIMSICNWVQISINDGLPTEICLNCSSKVLQLHSFKQKIEHNEQILRSRIGSLQENINNSNVINCENNALNKVIKIESLSQEDMIEEINVDNFCKEEQFNMGNEENSGYDNIFEHEQQDDLFSVVKTENVNNDESCEDSDNNTTMHSCTDTYERGVLGFVKNSLESKNNAIPRNTEKSRKSIWLIFSEFCEVRNYTLHANTTPVELSKILEDFALNMRKKNGDNYKESCIKSIWNGTAKMIQEKYLNEFNIIINPFTDIRFKNSRNARDTKRKLLQQSADKRKVSSKPLTKEEIHLMANIWKEDNPEGLQRKFYHLCSFELAWRGNEAAYCKIHYFREEFSSTGEPTGRIEYNTNFSKTDNDIKTSSKWLIRYTQNENLCPVRLFKKILEKRGRIKTDRMFVTPNPNFKQGNWYKNMPIGINVISKWTKLSAEKIGIETKVYRITNHSHRSSAISTSSRPGIGAKQMIKLSNHSNVQSVMQCLDDSEHHRMLIENLRESDKNVIKSKAEEPQPVQSSIIYSAGNTFINCKFNFINNN